MKTFNKKGDKGQTSLLYGRRVSKADLRCEAYGTIDEAVSALGVARNVAKKDRVKEIILKVQKELFCLAAEIAAIPEEYGRFTNTFQTVSDQMAAELEELINQLESEIEMPKAFIIPGANLSSATLDVARTIVRRAERRAVELREKDEIHNDAILSYLNRLADLLFTLARYESA